MFHLCRLFLFVLHECNQCPRSSSFRSFFLVIFLLVSQVYALHFGALMWFCRSFDGESLSVSPVLCYCIAFLLLVGVRRVLFGFFY